MVRSILKMIIFHGAGNTLATIITISNKMPIKFFGMPNYLLLGSLIGQLKEN